MFTFTLGPVKIQLYQKIFPNKQITNYNTIIVGDFNSKNIIWGSPFTCKKGKIIEDFMDFICLNNGSSLFLSRWLQYPILVGYLTGL